MKFNKDTFLNDITEKVQSAIDKNLITSDDVEANDTSRLHGFIQYELLEYIEDRKFAIDVLKDFNYDEKSPWDTIQEQFGKFKSLMDIALVNLWKFLDSEGATKYDYYKHNSFDPEKTMLDVVHDMSDEPEDDDAPNMRGRDMFPTDYSGMEDEDNDEYGESKAPRRRIRLSRDKE